MSTSVLIACPQCDTLQYEVELALGQTARCRQCNGMLYKKTLPHYQLEAAFTVTAVILMVIASLSPIATIIVQGQVIDATLLRIIQTLLLQQQTLLALLIFVTLLLAPLLEIMAIAYILIKLKLSKSTFLQNKITFSHSRLAYAIQIRLHANTWVLIDVFMLGLLVALVKLAPIVEIKVGVAIWAYSGLIILLNALSYMFDAKKVWSKIDF